MSEVFDRMWPVLARASLLLKNPISRMIDAVANYPKTPVRQYGTPREAYDAMMRVYSYEADPMNGRFDFYTHPQAMQWAMDKGSEALKALYRDCDDWAVWLYEATRHMPDAEVATRMIIGRGNYGTHQIVTARLADGTCWAYDLNGCFQLPDLAIATICAKYSEVYASLGYVYFDAIDTSHPWA